MKKVFNIFLKFIRNHNISFNYTIQKFKEFVIYFIFFIIFLIIFKYFIVFLLFFLKKLKIFFNFLLEGTQASMRRKINECGGSSSKFSSPNNSPSFFKDKSFSKDAIKRSNSRRNSEHFDKEENSVKKEILLNSEYAQNKHDSAFINQSNENDQHHVITQQFHNNNLDLEDVSKNNKEFHDVCQNNAKIDIQEKTLDAISKESENAFSQGFNDLQGNYFKNK